MWQALTRWFRRPTIPGAAGSQGWAATDVAGLQSGLEQLRQRDELQLEELRRRISQLESERDMAHQEVEGLRTALADTALRQEKTEIHANTLEIRLREQREQYQADLQNAQIRERRQARLLNLAMAVAIVALVLGGAVSVSTFRMVENNTVLLATINQGFQDIQSSIERYQAGTLNELSRSVALIASRMNQPEETPDLPRTGGAIIEPLPVTQPLPKPDFVVSGSLPLSGHTFSDRRDVRAFFEENARQPGIVTLPSGLQYRVLIPGKGRTPGASDMVVIEYRAFRPDGTELDNSFRETQPTTFIVSEANPGLEEALQHMQEGAQWELYVPPVLVNKGVRKRGRFGFEPLIYTVELLAVVTARTQDKKP